jgi:hypothetical protein
MIKSKKNDYKFWHSPISLVILFFFFAFFGYKIIDLIHIKMDTTYKKNLVLDQIDNLKKRESSLTSDISKLKTEEGEEEVIREKYQVAKEGEKMVTIIGGDNKNTSILLEENPKHGFMEWLKNIFKK